jgi:hypothetical protein
MGTCGASPRRVTKIMELGGGGEGEGSPGGWMLTEEDETAAVALLRELDREVCV